MKKDAPWGVFFARSAFESFARLFKGGGVQRQSLWPRSAERGISFCSYKRRRGSKGEPSPGVPPLFFTFVRVRRYVGRFSLPCPAFRPHFFGACPKKRCRAAKEKRFEASTSPWWAHPPLPFGRKPQRDRLVRQVDLRLVGQLAGQSQLDAVGWDVGASSPWERRAGPNTYRGGTQKRVSLGLHPVSLRKSKEMGWNGQ